MAWSSYYQSQGGAGRLSRLLKETKQKLLLTDAILTELPDPEQLSLSRSYASLSGNRDSLSSGISRNVNDIWQLPKEPYPDMRLWLKFESGLKPKDWTWNEHNARIKTSTKVQPLKRLVNDDGITEGQVYNIFDGATQWVEVEDHEHIRLSDMLMEDNTVNLSVFLSPFGGATFDDEGYTDLFYKVDSDEVAYAYRARLHADGHIKFTIIDNYAVQEVVTDPEVVEVYDLGDFDMDDFESEDFIQSGPLYQVDPDVAPPWKILSFSYNILTREMKVWYAYFPDPINDPGNVTVTQHVVSPTPQNITNLSLHLPLSEGNGTVLHDASGMGFDGNFAADPNAPVWDNGLLKFTADTQRFTVANHIPLNALSSFSIALKIKPTAYSVGADSNYIMTKGSAGNGGGATAIGGIKIYQLGSGSHDLRVAFKPDSNPATQTLTVTDAIPTLNQWYDVIFKYDGTTYTLQVGNLTPVTLARTGDVFTNSEAYYFGDTISAFQGYLSDFHFYKGRAWITADVNYFTALSPGYKGGFPQWMPLPPPIPEDPVPITRPLSKIYEVATPVTPGTIQLNNPASTTPFTSFYNVAGGTASTDPEVQKYTVPDGTSTGSTVSEASVYSLSGQSSTADIVADSGDIGYGQVIRTTGSNIYHRYLGKITITGLKRSGDAEGQIQLGIIKANGTFIAFGTDFDVSTLSTGSWTSKTATNYTNANPTGGYRCEVGDGVGFKWFNRDGTIYVQRGGSNSYESLSLSCQATLEDDDEWHITNSSYAMAGVFYEGGYSTAVAAYHAMNNTSTAIKCSIGQWQTNSTIEGVIPTRKIWRVRRVGTLSTATLRCIIVTNASSLTMVAQLGSSIACSSIGTTVQDLEFINRDNTVAWADGYRIVLEYDNVTGVNSSNYIEVNFNPAGAVGGTTIRAQVYKSAFPAGWSDKSGTSADWAGHMWVGGASFSPWVALNNTRTRYGTKINSNTPSPVAKGMSRKVTKGEFTLRKVNDPTGPIKFIIYGADNNPKASGFSQIQADSLTTSGVVYPFTWVFNAYINALGDYMVVEFNNGTATDYIEIMMNTDAAAGASGDGQKMIAVEYVSGAWAVKTSLDVAGILYEGGIPDLTSRNRVSVTVTSEASVLKSQKITETRFKFKKTTGSTLTGNVEIWSRRGSDDTQRDLLGSFTANDLLDSAWTEKIVVNRDALQYLGVTDKISIEYSGGNQTNGVLVMLNLTDTFDEDDTMYSEYDSIQWSSPIDNKEIVGEMWIGGDVYTPDPGTPYVPPPLAYNPNLFILGGGGVNPTTGIPQTMTGMRIRDFRLITGTVYGSGELTNLLKNKHTVLSILPGQTALAGYSTLKA